MMNSRLGLVTAFAGLALIGAAALTLAGCSTPKEKAQTEARASAKAFRSELGTMPDRIDSTIAKLVELTAGNNTNRAKSFSEFGTELFRMQSHATRLKEESERATSDSSTYFREWLRESMSTADPAKRKAAEDSLAMRRTDVDKALSYLRAGESDYRKLLVSLKDIQRRLTGDLSQKAIDAASPKVGDAIRGSVDVKNSIARLHEQIDSVLATGR